MTDLRPGGDPFEHTLRQLESFSGKLAKAEAFTRNLAESVFGGALVAAYLLYVLFVITLLSAPYMIKSGSDATRGAAAIVYNIGYLSCHQLPYRSIFLGGVQLPVCARDTGVFIGIAVGIAYALWSKKLWRPLTTAKGLIAFILPLAVDGLSQTAFNLWESTNPVRLATGLFLGFGVSTYIAHKIVLRHVRFAAHARAAQNVLASVLAVLLVYALSFNGLAEKTGATYMTASAAQSLALREAAGNAETEVYFIPPRTPLSLPIDPYLDRHKDNVVSDVVSNPAAFAGCAGACMPLSTYVGDSDFASVKSVVAENPPVAALALIPLSLKDAATILNPSGNYGVWLVVVQEEGVREKGGTYTKTAGKYFYFDALYGEIILETEH